MKDNKLLDKEINGISSFIRDVKKIINSRRCIL